MIQADDPTTWRSCGSRRRAFGWADAATEDHQRRAHHGSSWLKLAPLLVLYVAAALALAHGQGLVADEGSLLAFAQGLLHGHYATVGSLNSGGYLWHGPALPLLLAPLVKLGVPLWGMRLITGPLLLLVAVVLFERLLRLRIGPRGALAGAYALGLFLPFGYLLRSIAKEELARVLVIAGMHAITRTVNGGPGRYMLLGGLALGALMYDRVEYGWVAIADADRHQRMVFDGAPRSRCVRTALSAFARSRSPAASPG